MTEVTVRWPCEHGHFYSHYIRPVGPGKHPKCAGGTNKTLRRPSTNELKVPQAISDMLWVDITGLEVAE